MRRVRSWERRTRTSRGGPKATRAWRHWRQLVDGYEAEHPGRQLVLVAEAYTPRRPDILRQYANDEEFHQAFVFDLMLAPWNAWSTIGAQSARRWRP